MRRLLFVVFSVAMLALTPVGAQSPSGPVYSQDELDQLLAPVALYPDELLMQVLIAATYPLEVVEAARFVQQNPGLSGDALDQAVADRNWDPSVQSLTAFPQVLAMMSDKLEWMQRLGDAFLVDQQQVMDTVQALRRRAEAAGNLQSNPQQSVITQGDEVIIEPTQPDVVYVPVYNPVVVYGPWWAPAYPPWFWYPPPIYGYPVGIAFTTGIWFGSGWRFTHHHWGWAHPDWRGHHVNVNVSNNRFWNRPGRPPPAGGTWQHQPGHRRGVAYPNVATQSHYRNVDPGAVRARQDFRGHDLARPAPNAARERPNFSRPSPSYSVPRASPNVTQPAPNVGRPAPNVSREAPIRREQPRALPPSTSARPSFDPGLSRQQAQINAQRGAQSRQSAGPAPAPSGRPSSGASAPHGGGRPR